VVVYWLKEGEDNQFFAPGLFNLSTDVMLSLLKYEYEKQCHAELVEA
jgi:hypothetical protein